MGNYSLYGLVGVMVSTVVCGTTRKSSILLLAPLKNLTFSKNYAIIYIEKVKKGIKNVPVA